MPLLPVIVGPTAGYLLAMPLAAALVGALASRGWDRRVVSAIPAMLLGNLVILLCGFLWLAAATSLLTGALNIPALLAVNAGILANPPFWDDILGLHHQALQLSRNGMSYAELARSGNFWQGGSLVYR